MILTGWKLKTVMSLWVQAPVLVVGCWLLVVGCLGCADGVAGVFDDLEAVALGQCGDGWHVAGLAGEVDWDDDFGELAFALGLFQFGGQGLDAEVVGAWVDVDEVDLCAAVARAVGAGDEAVGAGPEPVAGAEVERQARQVQGTGGAVDRHAMGGADVVCDGLLKAGHRRALGEEVGAQDGLDGGDVGVGDVLAAVGDHGVWFWVFGRWLSDLTTVVGEIALASE